MKLVECFSLHFRLFPQPARATAWTTRPSLVGVIAANRLGMGLLRKIRASNAGSKRESTCGDRSEHPLPNLEPTYRLESKAPFQPARVEEVRIRAFLF